MVVGLNVQSGMSAQVARARFGAGRAQQSGRVS
jgi:hypothetical protein